MSKVKLKVMGHLDENLADNDITQGQGANKSFSYNNKKALMLPKKIIKK